MKMTVNVLTVSRYSFEDDNKRKIEGTKIMYEGSNVSTDTKKGVEVLQLNSDSSRSFEDFTQVPGKYDIEFELKPGMNGQVKMVYKSSKINELKVS